MVSVLRRVPLFALTIIMTVFLQVKADALPEYGEPVSIFGFHGEGYLKWSSAFDRENPGQLTVYLWDSEGEKEHVVNHPSTVIAVFDALAQMSVQGQADDSSNDEAMLALSFESSNDQPIWFTFQNGMISTDVGHFKVEGYEKLERIDLWGESNPSQDDSIIRVIPASTPKLELKEISGGFFTVQLPEGWVIETTGAYIRFGFRAYDPDNPARQIFYYGKLEPFIKSFAARQAYKDMESLGGMSPGLFSEAPVLEPATVEELFRKFGTITPYANKYGNPHQFPVMDELSIAERYETSSLLSAYALDESVVWAQFTAENNLPSEGLFSAVLVNTGNYYVNGVEMSPMYAYNAVGIMAPADEFGTLQSALGAALASFRLSESYIREAIDQTGAETEVLLQIGRTLSEASASYNSAWHGRQKRYDALSQRRSDSVMGYDRVYDARTGEVYRAYHGFYEMYDQNRASFDNQNLELITENDYDLYSLPVMGYIEK